MRLSASDLELIRTRPQSSRLYLSIFQPSVIFQAQVNGSLSKGAQTIPFDNVTAGSWAAIEPNFTAYIGSSPGQDDLGRIRVRSATVSQLTVAENSDIPWADNIYITVIRFISIDPVYPRIIQNPADDEDVIFYKDWDIPYTNQNSILGTLVNMGCHRAVFRSGSAAQISYSSTGTYNMLGESLSYHWFFEGGTPSGSNSANPGLVTYSNTGDFTTRLIVSGSSGDSDRGYRYISVYDRPGIGSDTPILSWELVNLNGSRDESGYKATIRVHENIDVKENAVVVIFSDDWYGGTNRSLGGNHPNAESIFFVGYVLQDSIRYNYQHSEVEFQAGSITEVMKSAVGFSISVESSAAPSKWYQLYDLDCRRAIHHYLKWHTMVNRVADFQFVGQDQKIQFFDADRTSMFDAIDNLMRNTLLGQVVSDRQGKVWMEVGAKAYTNPTGSFTSVMEITKRDWRNTPTIEERLSDETSFLELGGVAYSGVLLNTFSALIASAPGSTPSVRGRVDTRTGMAVSNQSDLNSIAGNVWANDNHRFPRVSMDMAENLRNLDIAPQETVQMNIAASDTNRNKAVSGLYIPSGFDWHYNPRDGILLPSIDFESLVNGEVGETVNIPISPADAGINTGFNVPGLQIPPLPILTVPTNFGSTTIIDSAINSFQAPYGKYGREANQGVIHQSSYLVDVTPAVLTADLMSVQFSITIAGIYQCNLFFTLSEFIVSGIRQFATMQFTNGGGTDDLRGHAFSAPDSLDDGVRLSGSLSGLLRVPSGAVCVAIVNVSGESLTSADTTFFASMIKVSAL